MHSLGLKIFQKIMMSTILHTAYGKIKEQLVKDDITCSVGIHYARPPVDELRFNPPAYGEMGWNVRLDIFGVVRKAPRSTNLFGSPKKQVCRMD